jgi:hypothetical protein
MRACYPVTVPTSERTAKRTARRSLRSLCVPESSEHPRNPANTAPRDSAFSRVFARIRWPSQDMNQSGRTVQIGFLMRFSEGLRSVCGLESQAVPGVGGFSAIADRSLRSSAVPEDGFRPLGRSSRLPGVAHRRAHEPGDRLRCRAPAEAEDPVGQFAVRGFDAPAVDLEEDEHRDQRRALVAIAGPLQSRAPGRWPGAPGLRPGSGHTFRAVRARSPSRRGCAAGRMPRRQSPR